MHAGRGLAGADRTDDAGAGEQAARRNGKTGRRRRLDGLGRVVQFADGRVAPTLVLKYNIRTRSLADQGAIEDVLAVENDVVPFDRADVLEQGLPGTWETSRAVGAM